MNRPLPLALGLEAAGVVERVGADVAALRPGDAVLTDARGFALLEQRHLRGKIVLDVHDSSATG